MMIVLLSIYVILGLSWYFVVLMAFGFMAFGTDKKLIGNWALRTFFDWIYPSNNLKTIVGIPCWILLWPISLSTTIMCKYINIK